MPRTKLAPARQALRRCAAPALAKSTVGSAMGAAGSDVALETADTALIGDKFAAGQPLIWRSMAKVSCLMRPLGYAGIKGVGGH